MNECRINDQWTSDEISWIGDIQHIGWNFLCAVQPTLGASDEKGREMSHFSSVRAIADESRLRLTSKLGSGNGTYCGQNFILDVRSLSSPRGKQDHTVLLAEHSQRDQRSRKRLMLRYRDTW